MKAWLLILLFWPLSLSAQAKSLMALEEELAGLSSMLLNPEITDEERKEAASRFFSIMEKALMEDQSFHYPFSKLKNVSVIEPSDKSFKLFTWFSVENYRKKSYGLIRIKSGKGSKMVFRLHEMDEPQRNFENKTFGPDKWPGGLYYDIMTANVGGQKAYILLGFHPGDDVVHRKMIEVLTFAPSGEPRFGLPVFQQGNRKSSRVIFQFNSQATMYLKFDKFRKRIIFDHLSPPDISMKNQFQHYGPDFSVDGFYLKGKYFVLMEDLDVVNRSENLGSPGERLRMPSNPSGVRRDTSRSRSAAPDTTSGGQR